ncbi:MAG: hypothetical protein R3Y50_01055 [Rikenellaceae bacterium]
MNRLKIIIATTILLFSSFEMVKAQDITEQQSADSLIEYSEQNSLNQKEKLRAERGLVDLNTTFVPKGQWIVGAAASYSAHVNDNYSLLIVDEINSSGYTFKATPFVAYSLSPNMAIGARFGYGRSLIKIDNAQLKFGDEESGINLSLYDYYGLTHSYSGTAIWRQYIPLGQNRRFALYNELQLEVGGSQSKFAFDSPVQGTFAHSKNASLGIAPGIVAFATDRVAFEVSVGVMGVNYSHTKQVHNQVEVGDAKSSIMNFKINILSIGLGVAFYL